MKSKTILINGIKKTIGYQFFEDILRNIPNIIEIQETLALSDNSDTKNKIENFHTLFKRANLDVIDSTTSIDYQNSLRCIKSNTYENMELFYRKQFSMNRLLNYFKRAFKIAPITVKNNTDDSNYKYKIIAIYLLSKYSKEEFKIIAKEFHTTVDNINLIYTNKIYRVTFQDEIKLFFKQFESEYLLSRKYSLAFKEFIG